MSRFSSRSLGAGWLALLLASLPGAPALAEPPAPQPPKQAAEARQETFMAEVWIVLGSTEGDSIDPALKVLPALSKPPFDSFPQKQLLSMSKIVLQQDKPAELDLPNGRKMRLLWLGRGSEGRLRIEVSINRPGKRDYLPVMTVAAAPGDPFFVAGQKHQGGTLILGVRVGMPPAR